MWLTNFLLTITKISPKNVTILFVREKKCLTQNPAYGRYRISRPMRVEALIQKDIFWGMYGRKYKSMDNFWKKKIKDKYQAHFLVFYWFCHCTDLKWNIFQNFKISHETGAARTAARPLFGQKNNFRNYQKRLNFLLLKVCIPSHTIN